MEVRIDQAGHQHLPLAIDPVLDLCWSLVPAVEDLLHPPVVVDKHRFEAVDLPLLVEADTIHIVDQLVGQRRGGGAEREQCGKKRTIHGQTP